MVAEGAVEATKKPAAKRVGYWFYSAIANLALLAH